MRFYTQQHRFYCGIDLHARTMYLCILNRDGEILVHRNMPAGPEPLLEPSRPTERTWSSVSHVSSRGTGSPTSALAKADLLCLDMHSP
jgi:hypothetical protein